jgi:hypothetical protein
MIPARSFRSPWQAEAINGQKSAGSQWCFGRYKRGRPGPDPAKLAPHASHNRLWARAVATCSRGGGSPEADLKSSHARITTAFAPPPIINLQWSSYPKRPLHPTQSPTRTSFHDIQCIMKRARFDSTQVSPPSESAEHHPKISRKIRACKLVTVLGSSPFNPFAAMWCRL